MNPAFRPGFLRCIRPLPLRLTLIDVRRPGEIMEDLRGFVLDKLTTIEMDMDAATSGTCERLQNGPVGPHIGGHDAMQGAVDDCDIDCSSHLIRDRRCAKVRRRREAPPHHNYLALCVSGNADNWRHSVRVDGWKGQGDCP